MLVSIIDLWASHPQGTSQGTLNFVREDTMELDFIIFHLVSASITRYTHAMWRTRKKTAGHGQAKCLWSRYSSCMVEWRIAAPGSNVDVTASRPPGVRPRSLSPCSASSCPHLSSYKQPYECYYRIYYIAIMRVHPKSIFFQSKIIIILVTIRHSVLNN